MLVLAAFAYADDLMLFFCASLTGLQRLLDLYTKIAGMYYINSSIVKSAAFCLSIFHGLFELLGR